ncbi:MAG: hypothetical protein B7Z72_15175, partial [Gemmatimonadetes bacterium 21-71-4]
AAHYSRDHLTGKAACKAALQHAFGLAERPDVPLFGMTGRLVKQKGFDLILESERVRLYDAQFVFLGEGEPGYRAALSSLAAGRTHAVAVDFAFTDVLEHRLMAGSDIVLMPSLYEPCGLTQLRAQRYGAPVIGRRVGGIRDTVQDDRTGFLFDDFTAAALDGAIDRALARAADGRAWKAMMRRAMASDFGWERAAQSYDRVYAEADRLASARRIAQRLVACDEAERELARTGDHQLVPIVHTWRDRFRRLEARFESLDGNLVGALRALESAGRLELMSSAATHGFLPLLARDESIRLQLHAGRAEHARLFGREPAGLWLPECAYRPRGEWAPWPGAPAAGIRAGIETHVAEAGYRYTVIDSHLARAGRPLEAYHSKADAAVHEALRSPYRDYAVGHDADAVRALVRDPASTRHVWSRDEGYPGAFRYLEFHKIRWPGGLK